MTVSPTEYFVDPLSGSDSNGGSSDADAWLTVQHALDTITRNSTNGDRINIKSSATITATSSLSFSSYGSTGTGNMLYFEGYDSSQGDGGMFSVDLNNTSTVWINNRSYTSVKNGEFSNGNSSTGMVRLSNGGILSGCYFHNGGSCGALVSSSSMAAGNRFEDLANYGLRLAGDNCYVEGNYFADGAGQGFGDAAIYCGSSDFSVITRNFFNISHAPPSEKHKN